MFTASPSHHSISEWRMQSIARDSDDSTDDEFFDAHGNDPHHIKSESALFYKKLRTQMTDLVSHHRNDH